MRGGPRSARPRSARDKSSISLSLTVVVMVRTDRDSGKGKSPQRRGRIYSRTPSRPTAWSETPVVTSRRSFDNRRTVSPDLRGSSHLPSIAYPTQANCLNETGLSHSLLVPFRRYLAEAIRPRLPDRPEGDAMDTRWQASDTLGHAELSHRSGRTLTAGGRTGEPETDIVVAVVWGVPVAVGGTYVLWFVVPRAPAQHPARLDITLAERL